MGGRKDDIQAELDRLSSTSDVELELAKLKGQVTGGAAQQAIPAGGAAETPAALPADHDQA